MPPSGSSKVPGWSGHGPGCAAKFGMIALLWAEDDNGIIGKGGTLPWHLPNDLKYFKGMTLDHKIVMGRKTFEGMGSRPLPKRENIILTRQTDYSHAGVTVRHDVNEVLALDNEEDTVFIIGGSEIFELFLPFADILYQTVIHADFDGDTYFPTTDWNKWELTSSTAGVVDDKNRYEHEFKVFKRVN